MDDGNDYRYNNRGGHRGSRGNRGNRGNRGRRGGYGRDHRNNIRDIDDYINAVNNNKNQEDYKKEYNDNKYKKQKKVNNIDDYFNLINDNKEKEEKNNDNYDDNCYDEGNNNEENNEENNYNIFSKNDENIYKDKKRNKKKINHIKNNDDENNFENHGFNKSNKEIGNIKKVFISYMQLIEIIDKDDNEIMQFFMKFKNLPDVFKNTKFTKDMIDLMTELLAKVSMINSGPSITTLNQILVNTNFIKLIKERLKEEEYKDSKYLKFLYNVALLSNKLIDKFTDDSKRIKYSELSEYSDIVQELINNGDLENDLELALKIMDIMKDFKEKEKHKKLSKIQEKEREKLKNEIINLNNNYINLNAIPIDYKERNIQLSNEDFYEKNNILIAPHIKSGPYISYERYINTMFYLEYEDCYRDLRKTINIFQNMNKSINEMDKNELQKLSKAYSDLYIYLKGEIIFVDINRDGVILTVDFLSPSPRKLKFTKRMITGSLIILTDNNYENYLLTTVYNNPYVDKKINENKRQRKLKIPKLPYYRVQLSIVNIDPQSFLFIVKNRKNLQIFESKAYFESYVHVMKRLKEINIPDLPFKEELVDGNFKGLIMRHVNENYNYRYNDIYLNPYQKH